MSDEQRLLIEQNITFKINQESKFRYRIFSIIRYLIFVHQVLDEFEYGIIDPSSPNYEENRQVQDMRNLFFVGCDISLIVVGNIFGDIDLLHSSTTFIYASLQIYNVYYNYSIVL